ncbi:hypothetical protein OIU84_005414 [Salix udensis]|uniref:Uncharacterized protein n=1 Tax=Salix udensis TaxID=889485 RepID=A0AAD6JVZ7_9ROSI|nr:hypothetical protein OIU84_005414 [Salix udensis]
MAERALSRKGLKAISIASHPNARAPNTTTACFAGFIPIFPFLSFLPRPPISVVDRVHYFKLSMQARVDSLGWIYLYVTGK